VIGLPALAADFLAAVERRDHRELIETFGEEVIQPTVRYGRGLRHGLVIGAVIAILYTPWPGEVVRAKLKDFGREAMDLVDAMRAGAADASA